MPREAGPLWQWGRPSTSPCTEVQSEGMRKAMRKAPLAAVPHACITATESLAPLTGSQPHHGESPLAVTSHPAGLHEGAAPGLLCKPVSECLSLQWPPHTAAIKPACRQGCSQEINTLVHLFLRHRHGKVRCHGWPKAPPEHEEQGQPRFRTFQNLRVYTNGNS